MNEQDARTAIQNCPSIFNDAIGPVMRGPSSSHCTTAVGIGRLARDLMDGNLQEVNETVLQVGKSLPSAALHSAG